MERLPNPTVKEVLKELGWTPDCATCAKSIVREINSILERSK